MNASHIMACVFVQKNKYACPILEEGSGILKKTYCLLWFLILFSFTGCMAPGEEVFEFVPQNQAEQIPEEEIKEEKEAQKEVQTEEDSPEVNPVQIYVDVSGEVNNPGVYILEEGARVFQAIEAAGGVTQQACMKNVNQARKLTDEDRVWIPDQQYMEEHPELAQPVLAETGAAGAAADKGTDKINLNTASAEELMTLNGIGKGKAEAIVKFREEQGSFQSIEQIMEIEGIKDGTFQKIKDRIYVG